MGEIFDLQNSVGLNPDPGNVKLFEIESMAPELWSSYLNNSWNARISKQMVSLDITDEKLNIALTGLNTSVVRDLLFHQNYRVITLDSADRFYYTEDEKAFPMDYSYAMVWAYYLSTYGTLPSEKQYTECWFELNDSCVNRNLTPVWENDKPVTCAAFALNDLQRFSDNATPSQQLPYEKDEVSDKILKGAWYRAKKFYAAAMREMCALYELVADDYEDLPDPPTVWWHPILDIVFKADGIGLGNGDKARPMAIAIYLDSARSDANIFRKAQREYFNEIHEMPITMCGKKNEIFLPQESDIDKTRRGLDKGRPRKRSYYAAKMGGF